MLVLLLMFFASEQQKRGKNLYIQTPDQPPLAATIFIMIILRIWVYTRVYIRVYIYCNELV